MAEDPNNPALEYEPVKRGRPGRFRPLPLGFAVFVPTVIQAILITAAEGPAKTWLASSSWYGWSAIGLSIGVGCVLLTYSRLPSPWLIPAAIVFAVVQAGWLVLFTLEFCCTMFGDCL